MPESFSWTEGNVYVYTGSLAASAVLAYAENTKVSLQYGWDNRAAANGTYADHLTGQRANVSMAAVYTVDPTLYKMVLSATAVHMKFIQNNAIGSGGVWLYSGRIDSIDKQGNQRTPYKYTIAAHFNVWSGW
jgi:hypothetical protein